MNKQGRHHVRSHRMSIRVWATRLLFVAILVAAAVAMVCPSDPPIIRG